MFTVIQNNDFDLPSGFQRVQSQRRPTDVTFNIKAGNSNKTNSSFDSNVSLRGRPQNYSCTHKYGGSGSIELEAVGEELGDNEILSSQSTSRTHSNQPHVSVGASSKYRMTPSQSMQRLEDSFVFVSNPFSLENMTPSTEYSPESTSSKHLPFRIPYADSGNPSVESGLDTSAITPRLQSSCSQTTLTLSSVIRPEVRQVQSPLNKYLTISGSKPAFQLRRRGRLSEIYPGYDASPSSTNLERQLSSPPTRLPGASLPPLTISPPTSTLGGISSGRRRSSSQPPLPGTGTMISDTASASTRVLRQSLITPSTLSITSTPPSPHSNKSSLPQSYPPANAIMRPYRLMNLLSTTMTSKSGGYITRRLFVPNEVWSQSGVKLFNLPEKIKVVETLCSTLAETQTAIPNTLSDINNREVNMKEMERWLHTLDDWNAVCDDLLASFGKKLGVKEEFVARKSGAEKVPFWVRSTNLDSLAIYVSSLVKLFQLAQILGEHTKTLLLSQVPPPYALLSIELRQALKLRLKRTSEFFSSVVLMFVMRDLYLLLDKFVRKGEKWLVD